MKILHIVPWFPPAWAWGGPVRTVYEICKELVKRGHEITVYTTDSRDPDSRVDLPKSKPLDLDGIRVYYFRNLSNWLSGRHHIQFSPSLINIARRNMKEFDIVHLHAYRTFQNIVIYHYAKKHAIPYVLHAHGSLPNITPKRTLKAIYDLLWGHGLLKYASKVIAITSTEAEQYKNRSIGKDNVEIIPTVVELSEFADLPQQGSFRERYNVGEDDKLMLYLGRIHQSKGIGLLVKAFVGLSEEVDKVKLAIVGEDDGYLSKLRKLTKDLEIEEGKILLTGPLYGRDRLKAYVDADVFVTPCFSGFPKTFVEACACGVPIVTTQAGDNLDWLDGKVGLVVPYDEDQLRDALCRMLNDNKMRQEFGEQGRLLVHEQFNTPKIVDQLEQLYLTCLERASK